MVSIQNLISIVLRILLQADIFSLLPFDDAVGLAIAGGAVTLAGIVLGALLSGGRKR